MSRNKSKEPIVIRLLRMCWYFFIVGFIGSMGFGLGLTLGIYHRFSQGLPDVEAILQRKPALISTCYDRDNKVFAHFYVEKREVVPLADINPMLKQASIAVEDLRFYQHQGIDVMGIIRAMGTNLRAGRIVQGGSTITQQLTRTLFLSREKKYSRKIKEAILALKIEQRLSKSQILERYFNEIYFGHGCYGIQAAAKTFFGKDNRELSLPECALLAGLPKAPNDYSPYTHPAASKRRRNIVLTRMREAHFITLRQYEQAIQEPFHLIPLKKKRSKSPYFEEYIRRDLEQRFGSTAVHKGGLKVYTTLDSQLQQVAQRALKHGLHEYSKRHGYKGALAPESPFPQPEHFPQPATYGTARVVSVEKNKVLVEAGEFTGTIVWDKDHWSGVKDPRKIVKQDDHVVIYVEEDGFDEEQKTFRASLENAPKVEGAVVVLDVHTGDILALVGGYDFERSQFNRAIQAVRQPGSAFKPIVYSCALDNGFTASDIIYDAPIVEEIIREEKPEDTSNADKKENAVESEKEEEPEMWKPENYDETFLGPLTLRVALEKSRNLVTIRLLRKLGVRLVSRYARSYGITTHIEEDLSMALGGSGVIPLELASVYAMLANGGVRSVPRAMTLVQDAEGREIWEQPEVHMRVLDQRIAFLMTYLMQGVIEHGTGRRASFLNRPMAGKTGTTNEFKDAWFVGFTPDVAMAVWVGFDKIQTLGHRESGAKAALPIWIEIMKYILSKYPHKNFPVPPGIEFAMVDKPTGLLASADSTTVVREAYLEGKAPIRVYRKGGSLTTASQDLSTNLMRMDEMSEGNESPEEREDNAVSEYPSFDLD